MDSMGRRLEAVWRDARFTSSSQVAKTGTPKDWMSLEVFVHEQMDIWREGGLHLSTPRFMIGVSMLILPEQHDSDLRTMGLGGARNSATVVGYDGYTNRYSTNSVILHVT